MGRGSLRSRPADGARTQREIRCPDIQLRLPPPRLERRRADLARPRTQAWRHPPLQRPAPRPDLRGGEAEALPHGDRQPVESGKLHSDTLRHYPRHRYGAGALLGTEAHRGDGASAQRGTAVERRQARGPRLRHHAAPRQRRRRGDQQEPLRAADGRTRRTGRLHHRQLRALSGHIQRGHLLRQGHLRPARVPAGAQRDLPREPHPQPRPAGGLPHTLRPHQRRGGLRRQPLQLHRRRQAPPSLDARRLANHLLAHAPCAQRAWPAREEPGEHHRPLENIRQPAPVDAQPERDAHGLCGLRPRHRARHAPQPGVVPARGSHRGGQSHRLLHRGTGDQAAALRATLQILHDPHAWLPRHRLPLGGAVRTAAQGGLDVHRRRRACLLAHVGQQAPPPGLDYQRRGRQKHQRHPGRLHEEILVQLRRRRCPYPYHLPNAWQHLRPHPHGRHRCRRLRRHRLCRVGGSALRHVPPREEIPPGTQDPLRTGDHGGPPAGQGHLALLRHPSHRGDPLADPRQLPGGARTADRLQDLAHQHRILPHGRRQCRHAGVHQPRRRGEAYRLHHGYRRNPREMERPPLQLV